MDKRFKGKDERGGGSVLDRLMLLVWIFLPMNWMKI